MKYNHCLMDPGNLGTLVPEYLSNWVKDTRVAKDLLVRITEYLNTWVPKYLITSLPKY